MSLRETRLLRFAFWLNVIFASIEVVSGLWIGSLAIISDAFHDFGDALSLGIAWYFQHLSQRQSDKKFSFGYGRFSTLGALINSVVLILGSIFLVLNASRSFGEHDLPKTGWMIVIAVLGVIVNGIAFKVLHKGQSLNEKTAALHLLEDVMGWIAVLIGAVIMLFTGWAWIDSLLSVLIGVWIGVNATRQLVKTTKVFLQSVPPNIDIEAVISQLESDERVIGVHDVRIWSLDGTEHVVSLHVVLNSDYSLSEVDIIRSDLRTFLKNLGLKDVTLQFESPTYKHPQS